MKTILRTSLAIAAGLLFTASTQKEYPTLDLGVKAPLADRKMEDVSGQKYSLNDLKKDNGLIVIFSSNTCPFVKGWEEVYPHIGQLGERNNIGVVLVNSNAANRTGEESLEEMKKKYAEGNYNTPYVVDENSELANAFGAQVTPHVFMFNKNMELVYKGSINDKFENKDRKVTKWYLNNALVEMNAGKPIANPSTRQIGCSIKRAE